MEDVTMNSEAIVESAEVPAQEQAAAVPAEVPAEVPAQEQAAEVPAMPASVFQPVGFGSAIQRNV